MSKKEKTGIYIIGLALLSIFTFKDLAISNVLYTNNLYGRFFEMFGEFPFIFLVVFGSFILYKSIAKENIFKNKFLKGLYAFFVIILSVIGGTMIWVYVGDNLGYKPTLFIIPLVVGGLIFLSNILYKKIPNEKKKEAIRYAFISIIYFIVVIFIMNLFKTIWGRLRLREMTDIANEFTPWYIRNFRGSFSNKFASFPSGHTMNSTGIILISLLPSFIPKLEGKEKHLRFFAYFWGLNVGLSRIIVGAHFASDVIVGFMLSILLFNLTNNFMEKFFKKKDI